MSLLDTASLIVTPNGYKEGKLYSVIPSDGSGDMSVVRATTATRVNSAGLVELVPYNLVQYSQDFSNAYWTKFGATLVSGQADPFGGNNAFLFNDNSTGSFAYAPTGFVYSQATVSIYAKYSSDTSSMIYVDASTGAKLLYFNPQNGTIISTPSGYTSSITDVGNGWYRVTLTGAIDGAVGFGTFGGGAVSTYFFGYQLVEGSTAKDYQKTETRLNIPRLDYSNGTCPSLLVEPQRTNLLTYSSSFDNADWTKLNATISANTITSPSGIQDADLLTENTANTGHVIYRSGTGTSNTFSFYAKPNGRNWLAVLSNNGDYTFFNIANGTLGTIAATSTATIEDAENGWYRCTIYNTHPTFGASIYLSTGNGITDYLGDGTSGVYIWGAQLEVGSYATSYIPTTSASVTRNADVISKTGISSLIGQTEGTLFVEGSAISTGASTGLAESGYLFAISDNTTANQISARLYPFDGNYYIQVRSGGSVLASAIYTPSTIGENVKIAIAYKTNDVAFYVNGNLIGTDTSVTIPSLNTATIGQLVGNLDAIVNAKAAALWQTRLTNDELATLTSL